jgi:hypothetical protein
MEGVQCLICFYFTPNNTAHIHNIFNKRVSDFYNKDPIFFFGKCNQVHSNQLSTMQPPPPASESTPVGLPVPPSEELIERPSSMSRCGSRARGGGARGGRAQGGEVRRSSGMGRQQTGSLGRSSAGEISGGSSWELGLSV